MNSSIVLDISTKKKATEYLHLFCGLVYGEEGPFNVVVTKDDVKARYLDGALPEDLLKNLKAPKLKKTDNESDEHAYTGAYKGKGKGKGKRKHKNAQWETETTVLYSNALFLAEFRVYPNGYIEMLEDDVKAENLSIVREGYMDGWRLRREAGFGESKFSEDDE